MLSGRVPPLGFGMSRRRGSGGLITALQQPSSNHLAMNGEVGSQLIGFHPVGSGSALVALHRAARPLPSCRDAGRSFHQSVPQHGCPFAAHACLREFRSPSCLPRLHRAGRSGSRSVSCVSLQAADVGRLLPRGTMLRRALLVVPSALGSVSPLRVQRLIIATTASADFSRALTQEISPGKDLHFPLRAIRLYLACLDENWASRLLARSSPTPASLPVRVPTVESLPAASFSSTTSRSLPCGSATVTLISSDQSFHLISSGPCRAHERRSLSAARYACASHQPRGALHRRGVAQACRTGVAHKHGEPQKDCGAPRLRRSRATSRRRSG